jgi:hypothetical protein
MIQRMLSISVLVGAALLASSCASSSEALGSANSLASFRTASVEVKPDDSGDAGIMQEIRTELTRRGLSVVPTRYPGKHLVVTIGDTWRWDLVMYLYSLKIEFVDGNTGAVAAVVDYRNSAFHTFPDRRKVVRDLFAQLDAKGCFNK